MRRTKRSTAGNRYNAVILEEQTRAELGATLSRVVHGTKPLQKLIFKVLLASVELRISIWPIELALN